MAETVKSSSKLQDAEVTTLGGGDPSIQGLYNRGLEGTGAPSGDIPPEYAQLLAGLQQGGAGERTDTGSLATSENAFALAPMPGYPSLSASAWQKKFLSATPGQVIRLQRSLVAAGYLDKDSIQTMGDAFDHATRQAIEWLGQDAVYGGYRPNDILNYRIKLKAGQKPGALLTADEADEATWKKSMADAYVSTWRTPPPPGYLDQFRQMNPSEFESYERAKVTWENSGVAEEERNQLASSLAQKLNGVAPEPGFVPGYGPHNVASALGKPEPKPAEGAK